jgi:hypothetical protein
VLRREMMEIHRDSKYLSQKKEEILRENQRMARKIS